MQNDNGSTPNSIVSSKGTRLGTEYSVAQTRVVHIESVASGTCKVATSLLTQRGKVQRVDWVLCAPAQSATKEPKDLSLPNPSLSPTSQISARGGHYRLGRNAWRLWALIRPFVSLPLVI